MSARVLCRDCGWQQHYRRPAAAHRAAVHHRCPPTPTPQSAPATDRLVAGHPTRRHRRPLRPSKES